MERRDTISVRFPASLLGRARSAREERESLNDLVVAAVERELRRREGLQAFDELRALRAQVERRTGPQPDSVVLIRSFREGEGRRD